MKLPIRWTVERTFGWLGTCRRLTKNREKSVRSSEAFVKPAMIHLVLNRLRPKGTDAEYRYRAAARPPYGTGSKSKLEEVRRRTEMLLTMWPTPEAEALIEEKQPSKRAEAVTQLDPDLYAIRYLIDPNIQFTD